jgi:hypothetical protein
MAIVLLAADSKAGVRILDDEAVVTLVTAF